MGPLVRIVRFTRELTPYYLAIIGAAVLTAAAGLVVPFLIGRATDTVVAAVGGDLAVGDGIRRVVLLALVLLLADLVATGISSIGGYWGDVMSAKMRSILSVRYFDKLLSLPQSYFDNELTGTITARLNRSITEITNFVKAFSNNFFTMLITTVAVLAISAFYAWPLALLLAVVFPIYMWLTALTSTKWMRLEADKNAHVDIASGRFNEVVGQIRVVKSFVQEKREHDHFEGHFSSTVGTTQEQSQHWHGMDAIRRAVLNLIFFAIYAIIFIWTVRGEFSIGAMVMLIQLMNMARQPVTMMSFIVDSAQRAIAGSRDYFSVMELEPDRRPVLEATTTGTTPVVAPLAVTAAERDPEDPVIVYRDVTFGYEGGADVLEGIGFEIRRGERVAFVGESGGGKTTLVNLLLGLYPLRSGTIEVLGRSVSDLATDDLRRAVGVVFQDASLFSGTIRENIGYGAPDATDAEMAAAARRANAADFVAKFPQRYETIVGERGLKLSGGQKQRISVARAVLKDAPILVLDEATSALDTKSERLVQAGLDALMEDRTSLIIAHRLSTISSVDRIVTLADGRIDEIGTPAELAASGGIYAELLALQSSGTRADKKRLRAFDLFG